MNNVQQILLKAIANLELNIKSYRAELQAHTQAVESFQQQILKAEMAQKEIEEALQKLEVQNENVESKKTSSKRANSKKGK